MDERASELYESWVNGNLSFVVDEVLGQKTKGRAAMLSALLVSRMEQDERVVFVRMLRGQLT